VAQPPAPWACHTPPTALAHRSRSSQSRNRCLSPCYQSPSGRGRKPGCLGPSGFRSGPASPLSPAGKERVSPRPAPGSGGERGGAASAGGIFHFAGASPGEAHPALYFGSVVGVGLGGHQEAVAIYLHVAGMEGEPNLRCRAQVGAGGSRCLQTPPQGPQPRSGGLSPQIPAATGCGLTAAFGAAVACVAEAGALLLLQLPVEALPAAPHCGPRGRVSWRWARTPLPTSPRLSPRPRARLRCRVCARRAKPWARGHDGGRARCVSRGEGGGGVAPLTLAVPARVAGRAGALAAAHVEAPTVPAAHATGVPGHLWAQQSGRAGVRGCSVARAGGLGGGWQGLTTEAAAMVPGLEAAGEAGSAEGAPGPLLVGQDGGPRHLPVAPVPAGSLGRGWPGSGSAHRAGPHPPPGQGAAHTARPRPLVVLGHAHTAQPRPLPNRSPTCSAQARPLPEYGSAHHQGKISPTPPSPRSPIGQPRPHPDMPPVETPPTPGGGLLLALPTHIYPHPSPP